MPIKLESNIESNWLALEDSLLLQFVGNPNADCAQKAANFCLGVMRFGCGRTVEVSDNGNTFTPRENPHLFLRLFAFAVAWTILLPVTLIGYVLSVLSPSQSAVYEAYQYALTHRQPDPPEPPLPQSPSSPAPPAPLLLSSQLSPSLSMLAEPPLSPLSLSPVPQASLLSQPRPSPSLFTLIRQEPQASEEEVLHFFKQHPNLDLNKRDTNGRTALYRALNAFSPNFYLIRELVARRAPFQGGEIQGEDLEWMLTYLMPTPCTCYCESSCLQSAGCCLERVDL